MSIYRAKFINCYKKIAYYIDSNNKIYNANNQKNIYIFIYISVFSSLIKDQYSMTN